jgi:hypothetical protein
MIEPVILEATLHMTKRNFKKAQEGYSLARKIASSCYKDEPLKMHQFINYFRLIIDKYFKSDMDLSN